MHVKLSVAIITFNHERFIAQALESVLGQRTNFPLEILVADDHSTDSTPAIVADFHRRHSEKIVPILRDRNIGAVPNFTETVGACRGEYVALLEGDDYWLDSSKLQRQVDFLEAHPDFAICCHRVRVLLWLSSVRQSDKINSNSYLCATYIIERRGVCLRYVCNAVSRPLRRRVTQKTVEFHSIELSQNTLDRMRAGEQLTLKGQPFLSLFAFLPTVIVDAVVTICP
jgi:glycosyltransferase involved in cell wall biosynthesis